MLIRIIRHWRRTSAFHQKSKCLRQKVDHVRKFVDPHTKKVAAALEIMIQKNKAGRLPSLLFIAEEVGNPMPLYGIVGRFRSDPTRAIGHLAIMKQKVTLFAAEGSPDI